jgi:hypothetical protein
MDNNVIGLETVTSVGESAERTDMKTKLAADYGFANCYTIGFDAEAGRIVTALGMVLTQRGDGRKPWYALTVGPYTMQRDSGKRSALHHFALGHAVVVAAEVVESSGKKVLRQPTEQMPYALVKADAMLPKHGDDGERPTLVGIMTDGETLLSFDGPYQEHRRSEALVKLDHGQCIILLQENGVARHFMFAGNSLVEKTMDGIAYAEALVQAGLTQLRAIASIKDADVRARVEHGVLSRVANAYGVEAMSQDGRAFLLSNFFKKLESRQLDLVFSKLYAITKGLGDAALMALLRGMGTERKPAPSALPPVKLGQRVGAEKKKPVRSAKNQVPKAHAMEKAVFIAMPPENDRLTETALGAALKSAIAMT